MQTAEISEMCELDSEGGPASPYNRSASVRVHRRRHGAGKRYKNAATLPNMTEMSRIVQLLSIVRPPLVQSELPSDLHERPCRYAPGHMCITCQICGATSGTSRVIPHSFDCKYAPKRKTEGPFVLGERRRASTAIVSPLCEAVLQHEFCVVSPHSVKTTLATYGAGPCVIVGMYDPRRRTAGLAHIDALTLDPVRSFLDFPKSSLVYIVGGDGQYNSTVLSTLTSLRAHGYDVAFAHVRDTSSNRFAIDCLTGETWINEEVSMSKLRVDINKSFRERMLDFRTLTSGPLFTVDVPKTVRDGVTVSHDESHRRVK